MLDTTETIYTIYDREREKKRKQLGREEWEPKIKCRAPRTGCGKHLLTRTLQVAAGPLQVGQAEAERYYFSSCKYVAI